MKKLIKVIKSKIGYWKFKRKYIVKQEYKTVGGHKYFISTVRLVETVLSNGVSLYETMIFETDDNGYLGDHNKKDIQFGTYPTRAEAITGHKYAIKNLERIINREEE